MTNIFYIFVILLSINSYTYMPNPKNIFHILPYKIINYITSFLTEYELLREIDEDNLLKNHYLSENPNAINYLRKS
jgi:hypothetical protein